MQDDGLEVSDVKLKLLQALRERVLKRRLQQHAAQLNAQELRDGNDLCVLLRFRIKLAYGLICADKVLDSTRDVT